MKQQSISCTNARGASRSVNGPLKTERPEWLPFEGPGNRHVPPELWAMSATQFHGFLAACKATSVYQVWQTENEKNEKNEKGYKAKKGTNGTKGNDVRKVNMYDICDFFVKPWTAGTGNSVALLLNNQPLSADLMISHAWAEDIQECAEALMLHFVRYDISYDTACWFCVFSMYQPGDCFAIQEQVALDPFGQVLSTIPQMSQSGCDGRCMVVIHTSTSEVYERLWCVFEIGKASLDGVPIKAACSYAYIVAQTKKTKESLRVLTENARCSVPEDETRIRKLLVSDFGGAEMLNSMILDFRMAMMRQMGYELRSSPSSPSSPCSPSSPSDAQWHAIPNMSFFPQREECRGGSFRSPDGKSAEAVLRAL